MVYYNVKEFVKEEVVKSGCGWDGKQLWMRMIMRSSGEIVSEEMTNELLELEPKIIAEKRQEERKVQEKTNYPKEKSKWMI